MPATQKLEVRESKVQEFREHAFALLYAHWKEVALNQNTFPLAPDWERYELLEKRGDMITLAAWADDTMVGYSVTLLHRPLHYSQNLKADNDVLFVSPGFRGATGLARLLVQETEKAAKAAGADMISWHAKQDTALDRKLRREGSGYQVHDIIYSKEL